jgi:hypothetical protein
MLKKPEQIYQEELKSDLRDLMIGLSNEEKLKLAIEMMVQLGVDVPASVPLSVIEESTTTTTTTTEELEKSKDDSWFSSFEGLFIDKMINKPDETPISVPDKVIEETPTEIEQKTPEITLTIEQKTPEITPTIEQKPITETPVKTFTYEKPDGWNKKREKVKISKVIWDGILDRGMDAKDQHRYDNLKNNFFIVAIISLLIYIMIIFNSYNSNSKYEPNKSYIDRFFNYCAEKYDKITGKDKITYTVKDTTTIKTILISDTPKTIVKVDTPIVVVPVVVEPKPVIKDTPVKKPVAVVNKNKKENLVEYIRTLPDYSKFGPMDLPYLSQDVNKVDWTFLRADGKSVHFHFNSLEGTFSIFE